MPNSSGDVQLLTRFFREGFMPDDNFPEDIVQRDKICREIRASLLIEANCTSAKFPAFMKCGRHTPGGWVYPFSKPYTQTLPFPTHYPTTEITWKIREFRINSTQYLVNAGSPLSERWELCLPPWNESSQEISGLYYEIKNPGNYSNWDLKNALMQLQAHFRWEFRSLYQLCSQISPYRTPEEVCHFWGNDADIFAELKLNGMWPDRFATGDIAAVNEIVGFPDQYYCHQGFPFNDRYGEIRMQLMKLYDPKMQSKILLPITTWMESNSPHNKIFCVPLPGDKQPLYNLDLLLRPENETVILTDSVELADFNQPNAPSGVVFTNFLCLPGRYEQVDWAPLQGKDVWYLVINHSGISLEAAYENAQALSAFLMAKPYEIKLKFIQVKVDYPSCYFQSLEAIQKIYSEHPPRVEPDSVMLIENDAEFDRQYRKAQEFIQARAGWHNAHAEVGFEEKCVAPKENDKRQRPAYLLRPFLLRGEASMLYASKSTGKSALAFSMAAAVVATGKPLFYEKWWTVPARENHALNKVLYLDFENGREEIEQRKIDFAYPYWPQDKAKREQCEANLIIEDMSSNPSGKDYSQPGNWSDIMELINAARNKGRKGQPVDLLVIDTVSKFTRKLPQYS